MDYFPFTVRSNKTKQKYYWLVTFFVFLSICYFENSATRSTLLSFKFPSFFDLEMCNLNSIDIWTNPYIAQLIFLHTWFPKGILTKKKRWAL